MICKSCKKKVVEYYTGFCIVCDKNICHNCGNIGEFTCFTCTEESSTCSDMQDEYWDDSYYQDIYVQYKNGATNIAWNANINRYDHITPLKNKN